VVKAFPASTTGHLSKLQKDLMELEQSHRAEVSRMNEKFETEKQTWITEQSALVLAQENENAALKKRFEFEAHQQEIEFKTQLNSLLEIEKNTQKTLDWTADQLINHKQSVDELLAEIKALKTSTSWRLTEPLRALLRKISG
jgi:hypothetical protein